MLFQANNPFKEMNPPLSYKASMVINRLELNVCFFETALNECLDPPNEITFSNLTFDREKSIRCLQKIKLLANMITDFFIPQTLKETPQVTYCEEIRSWYKACSEIVQRCEFLVEKIKTLPNTNSLK